MFSCETHTWKGWVNVKRQETSHTVLGSSVAQLLWRTEYYSNYLTSPPAVLPAWVMHICALINMNFEAFQRDSNEFINFLHNESLHNMLQRQFLREHPAALWLQTVGWGSSGTDVTTTNSAQHARTLITLIAPPASHATNTLTLSLTAVVHFVPLKPGFAPINQLASLWLLFISSNIKTAILI